MSSFHVESLSSHLLTEKNLCAILSQMEEMKVFLSGWTRSLPVFIALQCNRSEELIPERSSACFVFAKHVFYRNLLPPLPPTFSSPLLSLILPTELNVSNYGPRWTWGCCGKSSSPTPPIQWCRQGNSLPYQLPDVKKILPTAFCPPQTSKMNVSLVGRHHQALPFCRRL